MGDLWRMKLGMLLALWRGLEGWGLRLWPPLHLIIRVEGRPVHGGESLRPGSDSGAWQGVNEAIARIAAAPGGSWPGAVSPRSLGQVPRWRQRPRPQVLAEGFDAATRPGRSRKGQSAHEASNGKALGGSPGRRLRLAPGSRIKTLAGATG